MVKKSYLAILAFSISLCRADSAQMLAVLESNQKSDSIDFHVRAIFKKVNSRWTPFFSEGDRLESSLNKYPKESRWTVSFDGKKLGRIRAQRPEKYIFLSDVGLLEPDSPLVIPRVGKISTRYSGWMGNSGYRPLVLNSENRTFDPEHWKFHNTDKIEFDKIWKKYAKESEGISNCKDEYSESMVMDLNDANLRKTVHTYKSTIGITLITVGLYKNQYKCDGIPEGWDDRTYVIFANDSIKYLGNNLTLIDAGDYDGDGLSELIFKYSSYDKDGYKIYYNSFNDESEFEWSYH